MLYVTTRDKTNFSTAYRTLGRDRGEEGGFFIPHQLPHMDNEQILMLRDKTFGQTVADILNLLFKARLDGWDVDFSIGRYPTKLVAMSHRIVFAEVWHNPDLDFTRVVRNLTGRIRGTEDTAGAPTNWAWIAVRIAMLFGVFGELLRVNMVDPEHPVDVAVPSGDFTVPMAVWYAREMGLPIANIICGCNDNGGIWDLLHHGEIHTDAVAARTLTPAGDHAVPPDLERLIYATLGAEETKRFLYACESGRTYRPPETRFEELRRGMYAGVVSGARMESIIRSFYNTSTYIMDPYSALAYCSLQDYRTRYAEHRTALVLSEKSPAHAASIVAKSLGITAEELADRLNLG